MKDVNGVFASSTPAVLTSPSLKPNQVVVVMLWHTDHGACAECGLPAAFHSIDAYGAGRHMKLDAVCAANAAAEGSTIKRIDAER